LWAGLSASCSESPSYSPYEPLPVAGSRGWRSSAAPNWGSVTSGARGERSPRQHARAASSGVGQIPLQPSLRPLCRTALVARFTSSEASRFHLAVGARSELPLPTTGGRSRPPCVRRSTAMSDDQLRCPRYRCSQPRLLRAVPTPKPSASGSSHSTSRVLITRTRPPSWSHGTRGPCRYCRRLNLARLSPTARIAHKAHTRHEVPSALLPRMGPERTI